MSLSIGSLNFSFLVFFFLFCLREEEKVVVWVGGEDLRGAGIGENMIKMNCMKIFLKILNYGKKWLFS